MKGDSKQLISFFDGSEKRFIIPVYQRNYDWKQKHCKQLFDDLVSLVRDGLKSHFFGSIVSSQVDNDIIIIDGQQRITTVSILIIAMINLMKEGLMTSKDGILCRMLENKYIVDEYYPQKRKVKLKPFKRDCDAFDALIYKPKNEYIKPSKVTENYEYFYNRILNQKELTIDQLFKALKSLEIVHIQLEVDHGDNPQLIFESINSTGKELTEADKIRNLILMNLDQATQEDYYERFWAKIESNTNDSLDAFVRDYLTVKTSVIPNINKIYVAFKAFFLKEGQLESLLEEMLHYSTIFSNIKKHSCGNGEVNETIARMELQDMSVTYPFLLSFFNYANEAQLSETEKARVLHIVETFIFRRLICGFPTNALNKIFATLHKTILKQQYGDFSYSSVLAYNLTSRKLSSSFPKDDEFAAEFKRKNVYKMQAKNRKYIFERIENNYANKKEHYHVVEEMEKAENPLTIEHIMPQKLTRHWKEYLGEEWERVHEDWVNTIANLTLTAYNSENSNLPFEKKKEIFSNSPLRINKGLAEYAAWTEKEIKERAELLNKIALEVRAFPVSDFIPKTTEENIISINEDISFTGMSIEAFVFMGDRYPSSDWADAYIQILKLLYTIDASPLRKRIEDPANSYFLSIPQNQKDKEVVKNSIYASTNTSTMTKIRFLRDLLKEYEDLEEDDLLFEIKSGNPAHSE